ncbi:MAG TPA: VWA domain-containing protein [Longimicrobiales bacterium]|nr:VWA domain-containing protein [Longimicrobiales bacterium]
MSGTLVWTDASLPAMGLALLALVLVGLRSHAARRRGLAAFLGGRRATARLARRDLHGLRLGRALLLLAGGACLAAAAGEPYRPEAPQPRPPARRTVIALDVSASMQADDAAPTRLARAVEVANRLIDELPDHEIGLLLFAGTAYPLAPATRDHAALRFLLRGVTPTMASAQDPGTIFSAAIDEALALFERPRGDAPPGSEAAGPSPAEERFVVLIGDGDAGQADETLEAAVERARAAGAGLHVVGVGTARGAGMVMPAGTYQLGGPVVDARGARVVSSLREPLLRSLAGRGGGRYAAADDEVGLAALIDGLRAREAAAAPRSRPGAPAWLGGGDLPSALGAAALVLVLLESLFEMSRPRLRPLGREEVA